MRRVDKRRSLITGNAHRFVGSRSHNWLTMLTELFRLSLACFASCDETTSLLLLLFMPPKSFSLTVKAIVDYCSQFLIWLFDKTVLTVRSLAPAWYFPIRFCLHSFYIAPDILSLYSTCLYWMILGMSRVNLILLFLLSLLAFPFEICWSSSYLRFFIAGCKRHEKIKNNVENFYASRSKEMKIFASAFLFKLSDNVLGFTNALVCNVFKGFLFMWMAYL